MAEEIKPKEGEATPVEKNDVPIEDNTKEPVKIDTPTDSESFVKDIMAEIEREDVEKQEAFKKVQDDRVKDLLKEGFKEFSKQKKDMVEMIQKQNETIESLQNNLQNQPSGSKVQNPPQDNVKTNQKVELDVNNDDQIEEIFRDKFNLY